jgi:hypothetical protein
MPPLEEEGEVYLYSPKNVLPDNDIRGGNCISVDPGTGSYIIGTKVGGFSRRMPNFSSHNVTSQAYTVTTAWDTNTNLKNYLTGKGFTLSGVRLFRSFSYDLESFIPLKKGALQSFSSSYIDIDHAHGAERYYLPVLVNIFGKEYRDPEDIEWGQPTSLLKPEFALEIPENKKSVNVGQRRDYLLNVLSVDGFSQTVNLSAGTLPTGVAASFSPQALVPPDKSILTLNVSPVADSNVRQVIDIQASSSGYPPQTEQVLLNIVSPTTQQSYITQMVSPTSLKVGETTKIWGDIFPPHVATVSTTISPPLRAADHRL